MPYDTSPKTPWQIAREQAVAKAVANVDRAFRGGSKAMPGPVVTIDTEDAHGRKIAVTWRGGKLVGIWSAWTNNFVPVDGLTHLERERWASPPSAAVKSEAA